MNLSKKTLNLDPVSPLVILNNSGCDLYPRISDSMPLALFFFIQRTWNGQINMMWCSAEKC